MGPFAGRWLAELRSEIEQYYELRDRAQETSGVIEPGEPPFVLVLYETCERWDKLPCSGGLLDQPATIIVAFQVIDSIKAERRRLEEIRRAREE